MSLPSLPLDADSMPFPTIDVSLNILNDFAATSTDVCQLLNELLKLLDKPTSVDYITNALLEKQEIMEAIVSKIDPQQSDEVRGRATDLLNQLLTHPAAAASPTPSQILPRLISLLSVDSGSGIQTRRNLTMTFHLMAARDRRRRNELISSTLIETILPQCKLDSDPLLLFHTVDLLHILFCSFASPPGPTHPEKLYAALPALAEIFLKTPIIEQDKRNINLLKLSLENWILLGTLPPSQYYIPTQHDFFPRFTEILTKTKDFELKEGCLRMIARYNGASLFSYMTDHNGLNVMKECLESKIEEEEDAEAADEVLEEQLSSLKQIYRHSLCALQKFSEHEDSHSFLVSANIVTSVIPHLTAVEEYDPVEEHQCLLSAVRILSNICGLAVDQIPHEQAVECVEALLELLYSSAESKLVDQICETLLPLSLKEYQPTAHALIMEAAVVVPTTIPPSATDGGENEGEEEAPQKPRQSLIHRLIDLMQSSQLSFWTMRLIQTIMNGDPSHRTTALSYKNGLMLRTVHLVFQHPNPKFREVAMSLILGPATNGSLEDIQLLLDSGIVRVLLQILRNEPTNIQMMALSTIAKIVRENESVTEEQKKYFFDPVPVATDNRPHCGIDLLSFLFSITESTSDVALSVCIVWLAEYLITKRVRVDASAAATVPHDSADVTSTLHDPAVRTIIQRWYRCTLRRVDRARLEAYKDWLGAQSAFFVTAKRILSYAEEVERDGVDLATCDGEDAIGVIRAIRIKEGSFPETPARTMDEIQALCDSLPEQLEILSSISEPMPRLLAAADAIRRSVTLTLRESEERNAAFHAVIQESAQRILDSDILPRLVQLFDTSESEVMQYHTLTIISRIIPSSELGFTHSLLPLILKRVRTCSLSNTEWDYLLIAAIHKRGVRLSDIEADNPAAFLVAHNRRLAHTTTVIHDLFSSCQPYSHSRVLLHVICALPDYTEIPLRGMDDYMRFAGYFAWSARIFSFTMHDAIFIRICEGVHEFVAATMQDQGEGRLPMEVLHKMHADVIESGLIPHLLRLLHHPNGEVSREAFRTLKRFVADPTGVYAEYLLGEKVNLLDLLAPFLAAYTKPTRMRREICLLTHIFICHSARNANSAELVVKHEELMIRLVRSVRFATNYAQEKKTEAEDMEQAEQTEKQKNDELLKQDEQYFAATTLCSFLSEITPAQFSYFIETYELVPAICRTLDYQCEDQPTLIQRCLSLIHRLVNTNHDQFMSELVESGCPQLMRRVAKECPSLEVRAAAQHLGTIYGWSHDVMEEENEEVEEQGNRQEEEGPGNAPSPPELA